MLSALIICEAGCFWCAVQQVKQVTALDPDATMPFVGEALRTLRQEVRFPSPFAAFILSVRARPTG